MHLLKDSLCLQQSPLSSLYLNRLFFFQRCSKIKQKQVKSSYMTDSDGISISEFEVAEDMESFSELIYNAQNTNSVHGGSTKCRGVTSDEKKNQKLRSFNSLDLSHSSTERALLASFNEALQHLASFHTSLGESSWAESPEDNF